jgi:hypothetical protein
MPIEALVSPLPSELTTPPVTKICLVNAASSFPSAGFQVLLAAAPSRARDRIEPASPRWVKCPIWAGREGVKHALIQ